MDQKKAGREGPALIGEPRGDGPHPAASDQTKASPQPVFFDDTSKADSEQITGVAPVTESESAVGEEGSAANTVMDTGVQDIRGWKVRTVVLVDVEDLILTGVPCSLGRTC